MDREEILEKNRQEKQDEGEQRGWKNGMISGFNGMLLICFVLLFGTMLLDEEKLYLVESVRAVLMCGIGFEFLGNGITVDKKLRIVIGLSCLIVGFVRLALYFAEIVG